MNTRGNHHNFQETVYWSWPPDDQTPIDTTHFYITSYAKKGMSAWIGAARSIGDSYADWQMRRKAPIAYLLKVGSDAIHERLYYVLARRLNLPQQHVFWAITPPYDDLVAVAIQFEGEAFFPRSINVPTKSVTYRRKTIPIVNAADFWRHEVLHYYCGTGDIHQAMVKETTLFGIDAADCMFHAPFLEGTWHRFLEHYKTHDPERLPVLLEMMRRIACHPELPDLVEQELANAPGPVFEVPLHNTYEYGRALREMHMSLVGALADFRNEEEKIG